MHVSSFINHLDGDSLHSNQYAAGTSSSQTFRQRQAIERSRTIIGGYHRSKLANQPLERGHDGAPKPRPSSQATPTTTRQQANARPAAPQRSFREPPPRGFNPYS